MAEIAQNTISGINRGMSRAALRWSAILLVSVTWTSAALFGAYILSYFGGFAFRGSPDRWNDSLPALYDQSGLAGTIAIGTHFIAGGVLLLLGPVQLIGAVRRAAPALHRWLGRIYLLSAAFAGLGGLGFILTRGTIGGPMMDAGFGLYGLLMVMTAILAFDRARAGRYQAHRAWAIRLFALTIGSWLYRMEYGFWFLTVGRVGHASNFTGWFDGVMAFFFFVPNLAIAELFIRARRGPPHPAMAVGATTGLLAASAFVVAATFFFVANYWGPGLVSGMTGTPLQR